MKISPLMAVGIALSFCVAALSGCQATKAKIAEMKEGPKNTACDLGLEKLKNAPTDDDVRKMVPDEIAACKADIAHNDKPRLKMNLATTLRADALLKRGGKDETELFAEARTYIQQAADQGYAPAQTMLGSILHNEDKGDERVRFKQAADWYHKAAEQGDSEGQELLADYYIDHGWGLGTGQPPAADVEEAFKWNKMAAEQGNVQSETNVGFEYENRKSYGDAADWFRKAADQGDRIALYNLSELYEKGEGVSQSNTEAFKLVMMAAESYRSDAEDDHVSYFLDRHSDFKKASDLAEKGRAEIRRRDYDGAIRDITQAMQTAPDVAYFYYNLGDANFKKGSYPEARQDCDQAVKLNQYSASALYCRGMVKKATGDTTGGAKDIAAAQAIHPDIGEYF